jgi:hypothetical protein
MSIENLMGDEISSEFEKLSKMDAGTEPYVKTVDGLTKLMDRAIEMEKLEFEKKNRQEDDKFKESQIKEERKDRMIKNCIAAAGIVIPSVITVWGTLKSLKFEQEGTVTTIMGRGFINKLLPKK